MTALQTPLRLAMWSGPRNISTAMMRAWGNRADTIVVDEPLYAHYLAVTGRIHPGRAETLATQDANAERVIDNLLGSLPPGKSIYFQKHMAHHLLDDVPRDWLDRVTNCFLIRDPAAMLTSLLKHVPDARLPDTGLPQQAEIFRRVRERTGKTPPVIDSRDVLENPRGILTKLCAALGIPFDDAMLAWPPGARATDGAWAPYWYKEVERTTGFQPYRPKDERVPRELEGMLAECQPFYLEMHAARIQ